MDTKLIVALTALIAAVVFCGVGIGIGYGVFHESTTARQLSTTKIPSSTTARPLSTTEKKSTPNPTTTSQPKTTSETTKYSTWQEEIEHAESCPQKWTEFPVLLVSLDGFRAKYLELHRTRAISQLMKTGSHAPFMYPSFPSVTFPNHYALVTGLYPESHGIVANSMYDTSIPYPDASFGISKNTSHNPLWWGGEPIWNTVVKKGKKSATFFWPGSDVPIENLNATYWYPYDGNIPFARRVDGVIDWLQLPEADRPSWISLYFDEPDHTAHDQGPESGLVENALSLVDSMIDYLMQRLYDAQLIGCLNMVIVADHGMQSTRPQTDNIFLSDYVAWNYTLLSNVFSGPIGRISAANSTAGKKKLHDVLDTMNCNNSTTVGGSFRIYDKAHMPLRFHYTNNKRIGDVVVETDAGYQLTTTKNYRPLKGEHGYDFRLETMHALFLAYGPAFKKNLTVSPFQNIEIFNLMTDILNLSQPLPPNNGTKGSLSSLILKNYKLADRQTPPDLKALTNAYEKCGDDCGLLPTSCGTNNIVGRCVSTSVANEFSYLSTCSYSAVMNDKNSFPVVVGSVVKNISQPIELSNCILVNQSTTCRNLTQQIEQYKQNGISYYPLFQGFDDPQNNSVVDSRIFSQLVPMYDTFYRGIWSELLQYVNKVKATTGDLLTFTGPIIDADFNGLADSVLRDEQIIPTHYYKILVKCNSGMWSSDFNCSDPEVLSFVLPNTNFTLNHCSDKTPENFLFKNTARVRDIELATGLEFFFNFPTSVALRLRTHINECLWTEPCSVAKFF